MTEVAVTGGFTHPHAAELGGAATKFAITSASFARGAVWYAKKNPAEIIKGMLKEMSTFNGA